ncbi:hypothetical protein DLAC_08679 [Tieghemostelium lacteum]|uniref:Uncharacterized protein n=1 Tax=Tieghemostelium lacteum TaxID=361077 RepID=A0A151Z8G7_TIELA|nr:hypothetical protein DLAC_08679 [Tieghemostelium lacteum]|eukprot:KYQ90094.1 hypothetical protein DLAC_08679 [Tieghemostelium lacteum]
MSLPQIIIKKILTYYFYDINRGWKNINSSVTIFYQMYQIALVSKKWNEKILSTLKLERNFVLYENDYRPRLLNIYRNIKLQRVGNFEYSNEISILELVNRNVIHNQFTNLSEITVSKEYPISPFPVISLNHLHLKKLIVNTNDGFLSLTPIIKSLSFPNLTTLKISAAFLYNEDLESPIQSLTKLSIFDIKDSYQDRVKSFIGSHSNIQYLKLHDHQNLTSDFISTLKEHESLSHLVLSSDLPIKVDMIIQLLDNNIKLKKLVINQYISSITSPITTITNGTLTSLSYCNLKKQNNLPEYPIYNNDIFSLEPDSLTHSTEKPKFINIIKLLEAWDKISLNELNIFDINGKQSIFKVISNQQICKILLKLSLNIDTLSLVYKNADIELILNHSSLLQSLILTNTNEMVIDIDWYDVFQAIDKHGSIRELKLINIYTISIGLLSQLFSKKHATLTTIAYVHENCRYLTNIQLAQNQKFFREFYEKIALNTSIQSITFSTSIPLVDLANAMAFILKFNRNLRYLDLNLNPKITKITDQYNFSFVKLLSNALLLNQTIQTLVIEDALFKIEPLHSLMIQKAISNK